MPSKKKPASNKRASLPRAVDYTKTFPKDWERLERSGRYDMKRLKEAMLLLIANDAPLGPEWLDHSLKGEWEGTIAIGCFCNPSQREFVGVIVDAGSADKQALARALGQYYSGEGVFAMVPIKQGFTCKGRPKGESWCTSSCTCDVQIKTP